MSLLGRFDEYVGEIIDLSYVTHEAMIEAAAFWELKEFQVENGSYKGFLTIAHTSNIQLAYTFRSLGSLVKGKIPQGCYVFALINSDAATTHNGISLTSEELFVLEGDEEVDFTSSHESNAVSMVVDKYLFDQAFERYFNKPFEYDKVNRRLQLKANAGRELKKSAKAILTHLTTYAIKLKTDTLFHTKAEQDILEMLFQSLDLDKKREETIDSEVDANKLRMYIESHYKEDIHLQDVCHKLQLCERTVRMSFNKLFGFTPKHYLRLYRLGQVYHALLSGDVSNDTVEHIAYDHGFFHMGRFSQYYHEMYGHAPSHILKVKLI